MLFSPASQAEILMSDVSLIEICLLLLSSLLQVMRFPVSSKGWLFLAVLNVYCPQQRMELWTQQPHSQMRLLQ